VAACWSSLIRPPGTILQHMYLTERLRRLRPGRFVEVGVGQGWLSKLLLDRGWRGVGFELNPTAIAKAANLTGEAIAAGRFTLRNEDWLEAAPIGDVDLVISAMVLEHLDDAAERRYFAKGRAELSPKGLGIMFVPGRTDRWGPEDEIAGHHRRYTFSSMRLTLRRLGWEEHHLVGLTYPLSNVLRPLSDFVVWRAEGHKRRLSLAERTRQSGDRRVFLKTQFPSLLALVLNERALYPFHLWQKANLTNEGSLVLYIECRPARDAPNGGADR
jgi:SAM-dependent methyltransferase